MPRTWGETRLATSVGHRSASGCNVPRDREGDRVGAEARPRLVGKRGSLGTPPRSSSQPRSTATTCDVSGVERCLRPLPTQRTCGPVPRCTSPQVSPVSSDTLSPVWIARAKSAWSRRPNHREHAGAANSTSTSSGLRKATSTFSKRVGGTARTPWIVAACSG